MASLRILTIGNSGWTNSFLMAEDLERYEGTLPMNHSGQPRAGRSLWLAMFGLSLLAATAAGRAEEASAEKSQPVAVTLTSQLAAKVARTLGESD